MRQSFTSRMTTQPGMEIPYGENVLPDDDRINGSPIDASIAKAVEAAKKSIEEA